MLDYQDYRYILQDTGTLYVGAKFSFGDIAKEEEIPFKFRSIMMKCVLNEVDKEDTFESVFYCTFIIPQFCKHFNRFANKS